MIYTYPSFWGVFRGGISLFWSIRVWPYVLTFFVLFFFFFSSYIFIFFSTVLYSSSSYSSLLIFKLIVTYMHIKGTQDWEFFWLRFWNLCYFFVSNVKILRLYKKNFLIGPLLGEVRFFRAVLGLRGMKKNFEQGQKFFYLLLQFWTLNMTQY